VLALSDLRALISAAVGALPEPLRVAFVLRDVEELPMREVAEVLEIGESAAKMRVARARESLRVTLQGNV
jgi:RNA polymerase sigma-70 factor (ECF subfamily)